MNNTEIIQGLLKLVAKCERGRCPNLATEIQYRNRELLYWCEEHAKGQDGTFAAPEKPLLLAAQKLVEILLELKSQQAPPCECPGPWANPSISANVVTSILGIIHHETT